MCQPRVWVQECDYRLVRRVQPPSGGAELVSREVWQSVMVLSLWSPAVALLVIFLAETPIVAGFGLGAAAVFVGQRLEWLTTLLWGSWRLRRGAQTINRNIAVDADAAGERGQGR